MFVGQPNRVGIGRAHAINRAAIIARHSAHNRTIAPFVRQHHFADFDFLNRLNALRGVNQLTGQAASNYRFYPLFHARFVMVDGAIHHAMIGDGQCGHIERGGALGHVFDAIGAVEQRIFGMNVKMAKTAGTLGHKGKVWTPPNLGAPL